MNTLLFIFFVLTLLSSFHSLLKYNRHPDVFSPRVRFTNLLLCLLSGGFLLAFVWLLCGNEI